VRCSPRVLQELLQVLATIFDPFRVLNSHVAVMLGLPMVAALILFASWIGQNESVLPAMMLKPPVSDRPREGHPQLVARGPVGEVYRGTELVLAVARRRAHPVGARSEDASQPFVGESLLVVGAVGKRCRC